FGFLMDRVGWPSAFVVAGVATLLLTLVWSVYATDHPGQHPAVSARERQLIEGEDAARLRGASPTCSLPARRRSK
ncbi:MAG: hypothetical protein ACM3U2_02285, partial [Deltaproteobacteria bacterium]